MRFLNRGVHRRRESPPIPCPLRRVRGRCRPHEAEARYSSQDAPVPLAAIFARADNIPGHDRRRSARDIAPNSHKGEHQAEGRRGSVQSRIGPSIRSHGLSGTPSLTTWNYLNTDVSYLGLFWTDLDLNHIFFCSILLTIALLILLAHIIRTSSQYYSHTYSPTVSHNVCTLINTDLHHHWAFANTGPTRKFQICKQ